MIEIQVVDRPEAYHGPFSKMRLIRQALIALEDGKSIKVPLDTFRGRPVQAYLKPINGRTVHSRKLPDGIYLWLEGENSSNPGSAE